MLRKLFWLLSFVFCVFHVSDSLGRPKYWKTKHSRTGLNFPFPVSLDVGDSVVFFNSFEAQPSGDPGGWGVYTAFPATFLDGSGQPVALYYRGLVHLSETSSYRLVRTVNGGRSWGQIGGEETVVVSGAATNNEAVRTQFCKRFTTNRVGCLYNTRDVDDLTNPVRTTYYWYTDNYGTSWSTPVALPQRGTTFTAAGDLLELDDGSLLAVTYYDSGTDYRLSFERATTLDGASWSQRSTVATSGHVYESPGMGYLSNGDIMVLAREDNTSSAYRILSSDDGVTWDTPTSVFSTRRIANWVQTANGTIVASASAPGAADERDAQLYFSRNARGSWIGPTPLLPTNPDTATNDSEECALIEVSSNLLGIICGQERVTNSSSRLLYTEVGVGIQAPTHFRNTSVALWPTGTGSYADFGNIEYLESAGAATFEWYYRRETDNASTQRLLTRAGASNLQYSMTMSSAFAVQPQIASSLTAFASYTTAATLTLDAAYHIVVRYLGTCSPSTDCDTNTERLRVWINGVEDTTGTYSGTIPATMTAPNSSAVTRVGGYSVTANQELRDVALGFVRVWPTAIPVANITTLYNNRVPVTLATATALVGSDAIFSLRLNGDFTEERNFLGVPTTAGTITFSQRWVP